MGVRADGRDRFGNVWVPDEKQLLLGLWDDFEEDPTRTVRVIATMAAMRLPDRTWKACETKLHELLRERRDGAARGGPRRADGTKREEEMAAEDDKEGRMRWSKRELNVGKYLYRCLGVACLAYLPGRSEQAVKMQAWKRGWERTDEPLPDRGGEPWSRMEKDILILNYGKRSIDQIAAILPGRTEDAIRRTACDLRVTRQRKSKEPVLDTGRKRHGMRWEKRELEYLHEHWHESDRELATQLERTPLAVDAARRRHPRRMVGGPVIASSGVRPPGPPRQDAEQARQSRNIAWWAAFILISAASGAGAAVVVRLLVNGIP